MNTKNDYAIYIRATHTKVPVTEEVFKAYMRENDTYRRKMQRSGQCHCKTIRCTCCDTDCAKCKYYEQIVNVDSLDAELPEQDDPDREYYEITEATNSEPWDIVDGEAIYTRQERMVKMLNRLKVLFPEAEEIGELRMQGLNWHEIGEKLGVKWYVLEKRLRKVKRILKNEFREWM